MLIEFVLCRHIQSSAEVTYDLNDRPVEKVLCIIGCHQQPVMEVACVIDLISVIWENIYYKRRVSSILSSPRC